MVVYEGRRYGLSRGAAVADSRRDGGTDAGAEVSEPPPTVALARSFLVEGATAGAEAARSSVDFAFLPRCAPPSGAALEAAA